MQRHRKNSKCKDQCQYYSDCCNQNSSCQFIEYYFLRTVQCLSVLIVIRLPPMIPEPVENTSYHTRARLLWNRVSSIMVIFWTTFGVIPVLMLASFTQTVCCGVSHQLPALFIRFTTETAKLIDKYNSSTEQKLVLIEAITKN